MLDPVSVPSETARFNACAGTQPAQRAPGPVAGVFHWQGFCLAYILVYVCQVLGGLRPCSFYPGANIMSCAHFAMVPIHGNVIMLTVRGMKALLPTSHTEFHICNVAVDSCPRVLLAGAGAPWPHDHLTGVARGC